METIDQVTKIVQRQFALIARAESEQDVDSYIALSGGFLTGLVLSGVISFGDKETYMNTLLQTAVEAKRRLNDGEGTILPKHRTTRSVTVLCGTL